MAASDRAGRGLLLEEFVEYYDLPKWVTVKSDKGLSVRSRNPRFKPGDMLLLRTLAVETVKLSFYDSDAGSKREVRVPPDSNVKFNVAVPNSSGNKSDARYETVSELIKDCPTCFQANVMYDDPYLPAILRSGEKFRYIRRLRSKEGNVCLECENEDGNILQLPKSCKGDFSQILDTKSYTLKELIELSPVSRKLRFAEDNMKLIHSQQIAPVDDATKKEDEHFYSNVERHCGNDILQRITGLSLDYRGIIEMGKPDLFLVVSPCGNLDVRWKLSIGLDIRLEEVDVEKVKGLQQYDQLPVKIYTLEKFLEQFECDLPVSAKIVNYEHMPHEFQDYLVDSMDVVIHRTDRNDSVLARTRRHYYIVKENLRGNFRKAVRKYTSLKELKDLNEKNVTVKIMQDVASDFPNHFALHAGDILTFHSFESYIYKMRNGLRTYGACKVIKCERLLENFKYEKLKLPEDLEIFMFEVPTGERPEGFSALDLLYERPELPKRVDYLSHEKYRECVLPVDQEISLEYFVGDPIAIISPLPPKMKSKTGSAIDPKVEYCIQIPYRHEMTLTLKDKLEFPPGYFQLPAQVFWKSLPVEKISAEVFEKLVNFEQQAYEGYEKASSTASSDVLLRRVTEDQRYKYRIMRSLGKSLSTINERRRNSKIFGSLRRQKQRSSSEIDMSKMVATQTSEQETDDDEADNIYETYDFKRTKNPKEQEQKHGEKRSIFKRFTKHL
ncbi:hypothetical protein ScPMuIL_000448 [Solemya velum]